MPLDEVTREMRDKAKTVNFGIIYGISAFGLQQRLNIPRQEANELIENYFEKYPGVGPTSTRRSPLPKNTVT